MLNQSDAQVLPDALHRRERHGRPRVHECILDLRGITKATRVTVDDVAKCLVDFGFTE
jgi:glycine cleavage system protein P-like pyridoxal-binding family